MEQQRTILSLALCLLVIPPLGGWLRAASSTEIHDSKTRLKAELRTEANELQRILARVAQYEHGASREVLEDLSEHVQLRLADKKQTSVIEKAFVQFLDSRATPAGKDFICRHLAIIATESSIPVLRKLIEDPTTCEMARSVLEKIPGESADKALREALVKVGNPYVIGVINSIGVRRDRKAVRILIPLLSPEETFGAAALALARIGDREAFYALLSAKTTADQRRRAKVQEALMNFADQCIAEGKTQPAYLVYREMVFASEPPHTRIAGLNGLWKAVGVGAVPTILSALTEGDEQVRAAALRLLVPCPIADVTRQLIKAYPTLPELTKVRLLSGLADRNDRIAAAFVKEAAKSSRSEPVRAAGLGALARLGDASCIPLLSGTAADSTGMVQAAARASLYRMPGRDVDQAIAKAIPSATVPVKLELLSAIGERGIRDASAVLAEAIRDSQPEVRRAALKALREVGGEGDLPGLLAFVTLTEDAGERNEAARAMASACRRSGGAGLAPVVAACSSATRAEVREALVGVIGSVGSKEGLPLLKEALKDGDEAVRRAAILALGDWPDAEPLADLLAAAAATSLPAHHVLAIRSYLKLVGLPADRPEVESVRLLRKAIETAREPELKKAVLAVLPRYVCQDAVDLATAVAADPALKAEADQALERLKHSLAFRN